MSKTFQARFFWQRADNLRLLPGFAEKFCEAIEDLALLGYCEDEMAMEITRLHYASIKPNNFVRHGVIEDSKPVAEALANLLIRIEVEEALVAQSATRYRLTFENGIYSEWDELPTGEIIGVVHDWSFLDPAHTMPEEVGTQYHRTREAMLKSWKSTAGALKYTIDVAPKPQA